MTVKIHAYGTFSMIRKCLFKDISFLLYISKLHDGHCFFSVIHFKISV